MEEEGEKRREEKKEDSIEKKRFLGLDYLRGIGIIGILFFHSIVYQYGLLGELDIDNLNPVFMIIYMVINWGGLFVIISSIVNTYSSYRRYKEHNEKNVPRSSWNAFGKKWLIVGGILIILNYLYSYFTGPLFYNFETKEASLTLLPGIIRTGAWYHVPIEHILQGSILSALGWNLIIIGTLFTLIFRKKRNTQYLNKMKYMLLVLGSIIILVSFFRIYLFDNFSRAVETKQYFLAFLLDLIAGEYFPLFPYLGYGLVGAYLGLVLAEKPSKKRLFRHLFLSLFWVIAGVIAYLIPDATYAKWNLLENIFMSYIRILIEIALFTLAIILFVITIDLNKKEGDSPSKIYKILIPFSTNSLTVFLFERPIAELFAKTLEMIYPPWNNYIWTCTLFGLFMIIIWIGILLLLKQVKFKFTIEYIFVQLIKKLGLNTEKQYSWKLKN